VTTTSPSSGSGAATGGSLAPAPGAAPRARRVLAQARLETTQLLVNGEQLLLTLVIPVLVLLVVGATDVVDVPGDRLGFAVPGVLALTVLASSFTSLAIATGFERRYGVLRRLATTTLTRADLLAAKTCSVLVVQAMQWVVVVGLASWLGWSPAGSWWAAAVLLLAGTAACAALGLLMAGTLRAEATLAAANLVFLVLLALGGIAVPLDRLPDPLATVALLTPAGALAEGLRAVLRDGAGLPWANLAVLLAWAVVGAAAVARWFRWD
jgi:ABC-2 type transport system permease protein